MKVVHFILIIIVAGFSTQASGQQNITISGRVIDAEDGTPISEVEISMIDELSRRNYTKTTNSNGDFEITTKLQPGQYITIEARKETYLFEEVRHKISQAGYSESLTITMLEGTGNKEITVSGFVSNVKSLKPVDQALVYYFNQFNRRVDVGYTDKFGFFTFSTNQTPGEEIKIHIDKEPSFEKKVHPFVIPKHSEVIYIRVKKNVKVKPEWYVLGGGVLLFSGSLITGGAADNAYDRYNQNFNPNRQDDLDQANALKKTSAATFYGSVAAIGVGGVLWYISKRNEKRSDSNDGFGLRPFYDVSNDLSAMRFGLYYTF